MAQSIQFAVRAPLDLQDEQVINVSGIDFTDSAVITGTVDFAAATVMNLDLSGNVSFEANSEIDFTNVAVMNLAPTDIGLPILPTADGNYVLSLVGTTYSWVLETGGGSGTQFADQAALQTFISDKEAFRTDISVDPAGTDNSGLPTFPNVGDDTSEDYVLTVTDTGGTEVLSWTQASGGQVVTDSRLPVGGPVADQYLVGTSGGWINQSAEELLAALNVPTGDVTTAQLNAETTARIEGDKLLEESVHRIDFDTVSSQTGIHLVGSGPVRGEIIKTSDTAASIREAYFRESTDTISIVLLPDTAVLAQGQWTLTDDAGSGNTTIAQFPDAAGHPLVAGYGPITNPDDTTETLWAGSIRTTHWNGREFYLTITLTDGLSDIRALVDTADQFGESPITGVNIATIFRNVFSIGSTQVEGFLRRSALGVYSYSGVDRATVLGVTNSDYTAGGLQAAFAQTPQTLTGVFVDTRDPEYAINGFTIRNNEFYGVPDALYRFHLLTTGVLSSTISDILYFDCIVRTVVQEENGIRLTVLITDISDGIANTDASDNYASQSWLMTVSNGVSALSRPKAADIPVIHTSHLPPNTTRYIDGSSITVTFDSVNNEQLRIDAPSAEEIARYPLNSVWLITQGGFTNQYVVTQINGFIAFTPVSGLRVHSAGISSTVVTPVTTTGAVNFNDGTVQTTAFTGDIIHYDFSADLPLTIGELQAETNYEITYTLPVDATSIQIDFRGQPQSIYNNPTFTTTAGTHTVVFQFVNNANFQTLVNNAGSSPVYTSDEQGLRINVDGVFYNVHLQSDASTNAPNNFVSSGHLDGGTLTLNRRGLMDPVTVGGFPTPFTVSNPNGFVQADDFSINPEGDILTLPNGSMFESGSSVARWDVASDVPLTASEIIDETALPTGVTRWEDRTWEVSVTIPDTIAGPLLLEFHALTHEVAAAGPIIAGTYTYTFTFADFGSNVTSFIEGLGAGEATYGTESSNLRVRTSDYSEVHYAHFGSGALHPTSDHYVINGRVNTSNELELDIKGLGINAVTIGLDNSTVAVDGTTITGDGTPASPLMATNVVNTNNVPNNHIPVNLNGEFHSSGVQLDRPQLLDGLNQQWLLNSTDTVERHDIAFATGQTIISINAGDTFDPTTSGDDTYAFRNTSPLSGNAGNLADAILFDVTLGDGDTQSSIDLASEIAGESINSNGAIHALAIPVNVSLFERNAADNFAVLGPFTRYQYLDGGSDYIKLFPAEGETIATIHSDGTGVVPAREGVTTERPNGFFGAFLAFVSHNDDFITSIHKIRTDLTVATDHDRTLATKSYVDTVAGTGVPFVSQELFTAAFNFAYTLEQFNQVFDRTLAPLNATAVTTATITPVLDGNDFVGNGAINTALNEYQNASSTVLSADERAAIVAAVDGIPESSPGAGDEILADGGALITFALSTGEEVPLFVQKNPNDDRWFWIHGGLPQAVTINAVASVSYFDTSIPTFNDVNRLPFALISQPIDGVTQTVAELETIISDALGRGEVLEFSNDNFANVSTVTSANIMEDAFGRYYRLEFSEPYEGSFAYEDVGAILRLRTAQRDQVITSGSLSGAVAQDGTAAYVPGALYRETGFDADDTYFDVQPITVDGSHIDFKVTDKNGGGNFDQLSINIPELENLNVRVSHLEQGGTSGGSEGPGASYTPGAFKLFPSPWLNGSNELSQAWNNHRLSYLFRIPNAEIRTNEPANNAVLRRQVANFSYRNTGWRNTFGHEFRDTITHGTTRINPGRDLFRVLELSYLGETSEIFLTTQTIQNNTFSAAGFNNDNQRRDVTYQADGGYRADFFMNFGTPFTGGSINHELTLGITRVASSPTGAASYYEIRGGAFPQEITLTSGTGIFIAYLAKTPREGSQLGGVRNETTTAHGTFSVGVDATNRNPNFDETGAFGNEIRLYGVTQEQIDSTVGTSPTIQNDGTVTDEGTGWLAGGDGSGIFTGGNNGQATRTVSLTGIFRQREIPGSAIDNTSMIAVTYTAPSNERNEGAMVEGRSTTLGFEGTFRWLSVRLPLTDYDTSAALLYANIDTFGLNPITVREVWTSGTGTSSLDLHTLANTRVTILFPDPIDETWLSNDTPADNQVLTWDDATSSIQWEDPAGVGIVQSIVSSNPSSETGFGFLFNAVNGQLTLNEWLGVGQQGLGFGRTGLLPGPGANNGNNFLRGDGTWQSIGLVVGDDNVASTNIIPRSDGVAYVGSTLENEIVDVISGAATEVNYENVDSSLDVARTPSTGSGFLLDGLFTPRTGAITADVTNSIIFETIGLQYLTSGSDPQRVQLLPDEFYLADGNSATPSAAINLRQITFGGSLNRTITALTPVTFPSGANSRPISGIINFRQVDDVSTWHNTVNIGPANIETIPAAISASGTEEDIIPEIHLNGNVSINHGRIITGNGSGLTDISDTGLLRAGAGTGAGIADYTLTGDFGGDEAGYRLIFRNRFDSATTVAPLVQNVAGNRDAADGDVIERGDVIIFTDTFRDATHTSDTVIHWVWDGPDFAFGARDVSIDANNLIIQSVIGQVLTSDGAGGFTWVNPSEIGGGGSGNSNSIHLSALNNTYNRLLLGVGDGTSTTVTESDNLRWDNTNNRLFATSFEGDGSLLTNVGDKFTSNVAAGATTTLSPDTTTFFTTATRTDAVTDSITTRVASALNWVDGQPIQFSFEWMLLGNTETAIVQGSVDSYNPATGDLVISRLGGRWFGVSTSSPLPDTGLESFNLQSVHPAGQQGQRGEQGDRGFGVTAFATAATGGNQVTISNEDPVTADAVFFVEDGEAGVGGPFFVYLYQVTTRDTDVTVPPTSGGYNFATRGFVPGGDLIARNIDGTFDEATLANTGNATPTALWSPTPPANVQAVLDADNRVWVSQAFATPSSPDAGTVTTFTTPYQAVALGPAGPAGQTGADGRVAITGFSVIGDANQVSQYTGGQFGTFNVIVPEDLVHDFEPGQFVSIFTVGQDRLILSAILSADTTTNNVRTLAFLVFEVIQNDATTLVGRTIFINNSGPRGAQGADGIANITDERVGTTVTVEPTITGDALVLNGSNVTVTPLPDAANSVVPLTMVIDWVLYTSSETVTSLTEAADRTIPGSAVEVTSAIRYTDNRRLPGQTWTQYVGAEFNGTTYLLNPSASVFVSNLGTVITI